MEEDNKSHEEDKKAFLEQLNKAYFESSSQFDKQVLFIASGALGISLAFVKDIVKLDKSVYKSTLLMSWIFFGIVILISIISHYTSLKAMNSKIENINLIDDKESNKFDNYTKWFNILMIVFLSLGLIFLNIFIGINM